jgi:hypothetical protein
MQADVGEHVVIELEQEGEVAAIPAAFPELPVAAPQQVQQQRGPAPICCRFDDSVAHVRSLRWFDAAIRAARMRWGTGVSSSVSIGVDFRQATVFEIGARGVAARRNHMSPEFGARTKGVRSCRRFQVILVPVAVGVAAANTHMRRDEGRSFRVT